MAAVAPAAGWSVDSASAWTIGFLPGTRRPRGQTRSLGVPRELHQSIDGDDAFSRLAHDERIDFRLGDVGIVGEPRERDHRMRERVEIARRPTAVAGKRDETADLRD